jgi:hypothetical protein
MPKLMITMQRMQSQVEGKNQEGMVKGKDINAIKP